MDFVGWPRCKHNLRDPNLGPLLQGWEWTIINSVVEEEVPSLPNLIQRALNAGNSVYKSQGELELCAEIIAQAKGNDCKDIAKHLAMDPMIQKYADVLGDFCQKFSGGGILVNFLHTMATEFSQGKICGQEFWQAVVNANFGGDKLNVFTRSLVCIFHFALLKSEMHVFLCTFSAVYMYVAKEAQQNAVIYFLSSDQIGNSTLMQVSTSCCKLLLPQGEGD